MCPRGRRRGSWPRLGQQQIPCGSGCDVVALYDFRHALIRDTPYATFCRRTGVKLLHEAGGRGGVSGHGLGDAIVSDHYERAPSRSAWTPYRHARTAADEAPPPSRPTRRRPSSTAVPQRTMSRPSWPATRSGPTCWGVPGGGAGPRPTTTSRPSHALCGGVTPPAGAQATGPARPRSSPRPGGFVAAPPRRLTWSRRTAALQAALDLVTGDDEAVPGRGGASLSSRPPPAGGLHARPSPRRRPPPTGARRTPSPHVSAHDPRRRGGDNDATVGSGPGVRRPHATRAGRRFGRPWTHRPPEKVRRPQAASGPPHARLQRVGSGWSTTGPRWLTEGSLYAEHCRTVERPPLHERPTWPTSCGRPAAGRADGRPAPSPTGRGPDHPDHRALRARLPRARTSGELRRPPQSWTRSRGSPSACTSCSASRRLCGASPRRLCSPASRGCARPGVGRGFAASARVTDAAYLFPFVVTGTRAPPAGRRPTRRPRLARARRLALLRSRAIPGTLPGDRPRSRPGRARRRSDRRRP